MKPAAFALRVLAGPAIAVACTGCDARDLEAPLFIERAAAIGLDFVHFNGMSGEMYFCEVVGAGAALFDADNDGDLDLYLVQGTMLGPGKTLEDALSPPGHPPPLHDRFYRNRLVEDGALEFVDATAGSGLEGATGYGMGVAAGDVDNDGLVDLYVTNLGPNQLWRNNGAGADGQITFTDVTAVAGAALGEPRWSTSAAFVDIDRDGWLDLYVANYVDYRPEQHKGCLDPGGASEYCGPHSYPPETDLLLRNLGGGRFEDVSAATGILSEAGSGLGVVTGDVDGDGRTDVYVANDLMRNLLWINQGAGADGLVTFRNQALIAGAAVGVRGQAEASMGIDAGDVDNDGDLDLFMTHLEGETNTLYLNDSLGQFLDATAGLKLAEASRATTGFGTAMIDVDNDGWLDLAVVNGAVKSLPDQRLAGDVLPLRQPNQLFLNQGGGFANASARVPAFAVPEVSRGLTVGDVDNDGDPDLVVTNNNGPVRLLINQTGQDAAWLGLRLIDAAGRPPHGAGVRLTSGDRRALRRAGSDASYCSARDPRLLFGLGESHRLVTVSVDWPSGGRERFADLVPGSYHTLREGAGQPEQAEP